jgi:5'-deoxynucleotidase YfbR-like HD superfamily hydrolase
MNVKNNQEKTWNGDSTNWLGTYSGRRMDLSNPCPTQVDLSDIARALGNQCRYTGHVRHHYSVAEHCLHVADLVPPEHRLAALLHDAQEAYIADMSTPMKAEVGRAYRDIEDRIVYALDVAFSMDGQLIHLAPSIRDADRRMLMTERDHLIERYDDWGPMFESTPRYEEFVPRFLDNPAAARDAYYAAVMNELVKRRDAALEAV